MSQSQSQSRVFTPFKLKPLWQSKSLTCNSQEKIIVLGIKGIKSSCNYIPAGRVRASIWSPSQQPRTGGAEKDWAHLPSLWVVPISQTQDSCRSCHPCSVLGGAGWDGKWWSTSWAQSLPCCHPTAPPARPNPPSASPDPNSWAAPGIKTCSLQVLIFL